MSAMGAFPAPDHSADGLPDGAMAAVDDRLGPGSAGPGPLDSLRVVELAGIGPGPHACMMLADLGADVVRIQRPGAVPLTGLPVEEDAQCRGRTIVEANLKDPDDLVDVLALIDAADILVEGFRPGVTERLGLGPTECMERNPRLIYARVSGWGQDGPWAQRAGHDLNYLSVSGVLDNIGESGRAPIPPLNLIADFGGGSMLAAFGIVAALVERMRSGHGQIVDAAMLDGTAQLAQLQWTHWAAGAWTTGRGGNFLDGSAPFYTTYACADGRYMAVAPIERPFYDRMIELLGLQERSLPDQWDRDRWPSLKARLGEVFATRTQSAWTEIFKDEDACVTPVLTYQDALDHPHVRARAVLDQSGQRVQVRPAPRFSRSTTPVPPPPEYRPLAAVLEDWQSGTADRTHP